MRTLKELLEIVLKEYNLNRHEYIGLCTYIVELYDNEIITGEEYDMLNDLIQLELNTGKYMSYALLFKGWDKQSRIQWLKEQIELQKTSPKN